MSTALRFRRGGSVRSINAVDGSGVSKWRRGLPLAGVYVAPQWVSPTTGSTVSSSTPLVFTSVARASASHFNVQVDNQSDFSTATSYRSDRGGFEYWNGSVWTSIPTSGMPSGSSGNQVRFTPSIAAGSAYIRVRQSK